MMSSRGVVGGYTVIPYFVVAARFPPEVEEPRARSVDQAALCDAKHAGNSFQNKSGTMTDETYTASTGNMFA